MNGSRVAYIVSRFPKVSETFIANEISVLQSEGWIIDLYAMRRDPSGLVHPISRRIAMTMRVPRYVAPRAFADNLYWAVSRPNVYWRCWLDAALLTRRALHLLPRALLTTWWAATVARRIADSRVSHVHAHWATFPAQAAMVVSRLTGASYSFTAHAHDLYANAYGLREKVGEAAFVVTISDYNRRRLELAGASPDKIKVIRCGVDTEIFRYRERLADARLPQVLAVGALEEKKGHQYLIQACALLAARGVDVSCTIIGDGDLRRSLEVDIRTVRSVNLPGWRSSDEVVEAMRLADIFVMPSVVARDGKQEGIPVALMEAMSSGLAVVATSISGIPELVEDEVSGLLVSPEDSDALANAIQRLAADPDLRHRLGRAARSTIVQRFDLVVNARQLGTAFGAILEAKR